MGATWYLAAAKRPSKASWSSRRRARRNLLQLSNSAYRIRLNGATVLPMGNLVRRER